MLQVFYSPATLCTPYRIRAMLQVFHSPATLCSPYRELCCRCSTHLPCYVVHTESYAAGVPLTCHAMQSIQRAMLQVFYSPATLCAPYRIRAMLQVFHSPATLCSPYRELYCRCSTHLPRYAVHTESYAADVLLTCHAMQSIQRAMLQVFYSPATLCSPYRIRAMLQVFYSPATLCSPYRIRAMLQVFYSPATLCSPYRELCCRWSTHLPRYAVHTESYAAGVLLTCHAMQSIQNKSYAAGVPLTCHAMQSIQRAMLQVFYSPATLCSPYRELCCRCSTHLPRYAVHTESYAAGVPLTCHAMQSIQRAMLQVFHSPATLCSPYRELCCRCSTHLPRYAVHTE